MSREGREANNTRTCVVSLQRRSDEVVAAVAGCILRPRHGYVSRVPDTLDDEALVDRSIRGRVESVDVPRLLRRWAQT